MWCKLRQTFHFVLIVQLRGDTQLGFLRKLIARCKEDMLAHVAILHQQKSFKAVTVVEDVDVV